MNDPLKDLAGEASPKTDEALKKLASPRANVIRDGKEQNISAQQLVPGPTRSDLRADRCILDLHAFSDV